MQTKSQLLGFSSDERRQADEGPHDLESWRRPSPGPSGHPLPVKRGEGRAALHFALEKASQTPPPMRKLPLSRDNSLMRRAVSIRPARPAAMA